jgi:hypothetical protein
MPTGEKGLPPSPWKGEGGDGGGRRGPTAVRVSAGKVDDANPHHFADTSPP